MPMDVVLGSLHAQLERPQTRKFAWPIVLLPELFATSRHLMFMAGHLVSLGWEVYLLDIYTPSTLPSAHNKAGAGAFYELVHNIQTAMASVGSEVIIIGHGLGGLLALKLAEAASLRPAVALAPLIPGFPSPLFYRRRWMKFWRSEAAGPPDGHKMLDLVSEAEPFQRASLLKAMISADTGAAMEVARGAVEFARHQTPRLIVSGEADAFAPWQPAAKFAAKIGAQFVSLPGRGHWLVAGRALQSTVAHVQRFLVRASGEDLLLLYPQASGDDAE
jgi:pimeloyl-ACP methyl ester carboxylesterase